MSDLDRLDRVTETGLIVRETVLPDPTHPAVAERLAELAALPAPADLPRTPALPNRAARRAALRRAGRRRGTRPADQVD